MLSRPFWLQRIAAAWREAPIVWLCGVRRSGKTVLAESLGPDQTLFVNCDLPAAEDMVYWRDKGGREIDFVLAQRRDQVDVVECKWNASAFDASALKIFRDYYPKGKNYLVTPSGDPAYTKAYGDQKVLVCTPAQLH